MCGSVFFVLKDLGCSDASDRPEYIENAGALVTEASQANKSLQKEELEIPGKWDIQFLAEWGSSALSSKCAQ